MARTRRRTVLAASVLVLAALVLAIAFVAPDDTPRRPAVPIHLIIRNATPADIIVLDVDIEDRNEPLRNRRADLVPPPDAGSQHVHAIAFHGRGHGWGARVRRLSDGQEFEFGSAVPADADEMCEAVVTILPDRLHAVGCMSMGPGKDASYR